MLVSVRDERCRARPIELLSCSPRVELASMRLQPAGQALSPPVLAVVALLACRSPPLPSMASSRQKGGSTCWCRYVRSAAERDDASY